MPRLDVATSSPGDGELAALVVTYFPDEGLCARIDALLQQFDRLVLVDNGSDDTSLQLLTRYEHRTDITLHRNASNVGIAKALNQGLRILAAEGFSWAVTFDQDSMIRPGFVAAMLKTLASQQHPGRVALIGSNRIDPDNDIVHRWLRPRRSFPFFERVSCEGAADGVTLVITSGAMTSLSAFERLGGFREELFIDLVDIEYCLRAREQGYKILVSCGAHLVHKVGSKTQLTFGRFTISATHHSQLRKYYLFRNSVFVLRNNGWSQPHWFVYHLLAISEVLVGIFLSESQKLRKIHACLLGVVDGFKGKLGPCRRDWGQH